MPVVTLSPTQHLEATIQTLRNHKNAEGLLRVEVLLMKKELNLWKKD
jgi:hypothetical protein